MSQAEQKLLELGHRLPEAVAPVANYVPYVVSGKTLYLAGQLPIRDGKVVYAGEVGHDVSVDQAYMAARLCAINLLAQMKAACGGDLDRVARVLKLTGYVSCEHDFTDIPKCINGASDLLVDVFGDAGKHARAAVGVASLPANACVEIDAIVELK
jgi:enamine deaminase RidA (YjgF/YER057c/UK114 family)